MGFIDPNDFEMVALDTASAMGGAYLESEGLTVTNPQDWTPQQWTTLVGAICAGYVTSLQDQQEQALVALRKVTNCPPLGGGQFPSFQLNSDLPK